MAYVILKELFTQNSNMQSGFFYHPHDDKLKYDIITDALHEQHDTSREPHLVTQVELNDFIRDLYFSKKQAALLGSRMKSWNLLHPDT